MAFLPLYHERNMKNIAQLGDKTKALALKVYAEAIQANINILIYETIRTVEQQRQNVASGASQTMNSYHLVGQAFDAVLCNGKSANWNGYNTADFVKFRNIALKHGFTWGGDWNGNGTSRDETFIDSPHFQYGKIGYGRDTFKTKGKASLPNVVAPVKPTAPAVNYGTPSASNVLVGEVTTDVWAQKQASFSEDGRVQVLKKFTRWKVFAEKNGYYQVSKTAWVNKGYVKLVGKAEPAQPAYKVGEITGDVWTQKQPAFSETGRVKVLKAKTRWKVFSEKDGYFQVGQNEWVNKKYMKLV